MLGRKLYEQSDIVVRLTIQMGITDGVWVNLLRWAQHGECHEEDPKKLCGFILTDTQYLTGTSAEFASKWRWRQSPREAAEANGKNKVD